MRFHPPTQHPKGPLEAGAGLAAAALLAFLLSAGLAGCRAAQAPAAEPAPAEAGAVTDSRDDGPVVDLTLEVIVHGSAGAADPAERPARYLVLPDGELRYTDDPGGSPVSTRILPRDQFASLAGDLTALPLTEAAVNTELIVPADGEQVVIVDAWRDGRRSQSVLRGDAAAPVPDLVRRLSELAWVERDRNRRRTSGPKRYDLGADPYARYR